MARTRYASDRGLIARMGATMFLLGLVFTGFIIALYFVFFWYGHRHGGGGSSAGLVVLAAVVGVAVAVGGGQLSDKIPPATPGGRAGSPPRCAVHRRVIDRDLPPAEQRQPTTAPCPGKESEPRR